MTLKRKKQFLYTFAFTCFAASLWTILSGAFNPIELEAAESVRQNPGRKDATDRKDPSTPSKSTDPVVSPLDHRKVTRRNWRGPLYDPPPPPKPVVKPRPRPKPKPLSIQLVGIALEDDLPSAMFTDRRGNVFIAVVDETFQSPTGDVTIVEVTKEFVRIEFEGKLRHIPTDPKAGRR